MFDITKMVRDLVYIVLNMSYFVQYILQPLKLTLLTKSSQKEYVEVTSTGLM